VLLIRRTSTPSIFEGFKVIITCSGQKTPEKTLGIFQIPVFYVCGSVSIYPQK